MKDILKNTAISHGAAVIATIALGIVVYRYVIAAGWIVRAAKAVKRAVRFDGYSDNGYFGRDED